MKQNKNMPMIISKVATRTSPKAEILVKALLMLTAIAMLLRIVCF
jgi:hypothetical protein